jgi:hypothetical protein
LTAKELCIARAIRPAVPGRPHIASSRASHAANASPPNRPALVPARIASQARQSCAAESES